MSCWTSHYCVRLHWPRASIAPWASCARISFFDVRGSRLTGRVTIAWTVSEDGTPEDVKVESSTLGDTEAESCMATRVRRLHFPAPRGGAVRVEFPFVFEASIDERG